MAGMTLLAADQLDWYVGKPWAMIIDVRNRREYEKGHVKGAVNLPMTICSNGSVCRGTKFL